MVEQDQKRTFFPPEIWFHDGPPENMSILFSSYVPLVYTVADSHTLF